MSLLDHYSRLSNPSLKKLIGDCFAKIPTARPASTFLAQRFLDYYNNCSANSEGTQADAEVIKIKEKCSALVHNRRLNHKTTPIMQEMLTNSETLTLLHHEDSWDDAACLRLAPEISFLVGAGIFWGLIDTKDVYELSYDSSRVTNSVEGPYKLVPANCQ